MSTNRRTPQLSAVELIDATNQRWDVIVIGAGPAGALAARQTAHSGAQVLLVDKSSFPRGKVCGCCLNGAALDTLAQVGLGDLTRELGAQPLHDWQLLTAVGSAVCPLPAGVALSRDALDTALVAEAIEAGAKFLPKTQALVLGSGDCTRGVELRSDERRVTVQARLVVCADGLNGGALRAVPGLRQQIEPASRIGAGTVVESPPDSFRPGRIYMACGRGGYVGLVRLEDGRLDVAAALDVKVTRHAGSAATVAASILEAVRLPAPSDLASAAWRGTSKLTHRPSAVAAERLLVIGDAAGYVEPFTGEGIAWALMSGVAVAPLAVYSIDDWSPGIADAWLGTLRRLVGHRQRICRITSRVLRSPLLTGAMARVLALQPRMAGPVIRALNAPPRFHACETTMIERSL